MNIYKEICKKLFNVALIYAVVFIIPITKNCLAADLSELMPECVEWLDRSQEFLNECRMHGRPFKKIFKGDTIVGVDRIYKIAEDTVMERYILFDQNSKNKHFLTGCVLDERKNLSYLGIYYAMEPDFIVGSNKIRIFDIDVKDNIVLQDGDLTGVFIPVRPFNIGNINTPWKYHIHSQKNCGPIKNENGSYPLLSGNVHVNFSNFQNDRTIEIGGTFTSIERKKFINIFAYQDDFSKINLIYSWNNHIIVTISGELYVSEISIRKYCYSIEDRYFDRPTLFLLQICKKYKNKVY